MDRRKVENRHQGQELTSDKALPTSKEALLDRYNKTKRRSTPQPSPANSDDEASSNDASYIDDDDDDTKVGLVFGEDESCLESSDDELEYDLEAVDNE